MKVANEYWKLTGIFWLSLIDTMILRDDFAWICLAIITFTFMILAMSADIDEGAVLK